MVMTTKHTSTDLELVDIRIREALKSLAISDVAITENLQDLSMENIRRFAETGGLGSCVGKFDIMAEDADDLMFLAGERIIVLKYLFDDQYLGYCEGVVGNFNAENVHFVELDPRVLDSLDSEQYSEGNDYYENRRMSDSWRSSTTWQSDQMDGHAAASTSSINSFPSEGGRDRPYYSRTSLDSSWTGSSLPSIRSRQSHDYARPSIPWHDMQNPMRSSQSLSKLSSLGNHSYRGAPYMPSISASVPDDLESFDTSDMNETYSDESDHDGDLSSATANKKEKRLPAPPRNFTDPNLSTRAKSVVSDIPISEAYVSAKVDKDSPLVDEYGFMWQSKKDMPPPVNLILNKATMKEYREREVKWLSVVSKMDVGTAEKDSKLKKLVRSGIPASIRARSWQFLARSRDYSKPGLYQSLLQGAKGNIHTVIDLDVARCFPNHVHFMDENGEGRKDLRNVLSAYAQYNSDLGYCQGMHCLAGCMLMQMPAEDAFWLLVATVDRYLKGYFGPELSQIRIDTAIIGELIREHQPKLAQHLESNGVTPVMYIPSWFLTAFTLSLPWSSVLRLWDVFYFEGVKVFYRISLAILEICKDYLLNCRSDTELLTFLLHIPHKYLGPDLLLETAFRIKLSKTDIAKYARKAAHMDSSVAGLPFESGLENLKVGNNHSNTSLPSLKSLSGLGKRIKSNRQPHTLPR
ncbi:hypothetical protein INT43_006350 [Umbelopsis isabellina]|uniref:Rab-GAP TBC domain-containing protein n=1 Tax=Mortierella isabellina TaxID=91625 RepID=A0A8H7Q114_MORIS|nr:hypothetical protein INT43_006350 [Umbelopsis isabellina]